MAAIALLALSIAAPCVAHQSATELERKIVAGFLFNFARFVEWPDGEGVLRLTIVDDDGLAEVLGEAVQGQSIRGHRIEVESVQWPTDAGERAAIGAESHLVYLHDIPAEQATELLRRNGVLTVGDGEPFVDAGGVLALWQRDNKLRFFVNVDALERSGLSMSSKLLKLADIVRDKERP